MSTMGKNRVVSPGQGNKPHSLSEGRAWEVAGPFEPRYQSGGRLKGLTRNGVYPLCLRQKRQRIVVITLSCCVPTRTGHLIPFNPRENVEPVGVHAHFTGDKTSQKG